MSFAGNIFTKDTYFNYPKQVAVMRVFDEGEVDAFVGIAYRDEVICGCCGTVFDREELAEEGAVYKVLEWVSISEEIAGGEDPFEDDEDEESDS